MTTGIADPIIRPIGNPIESYDSLSSVTKPAERIEVSYDTFEHKLRIGDQITEQSVIILDHAEFFVREGQRMGCAPSNKLGYVTGEQMQQGSISMEQFASMERVSWDWNSFVLNGKRIYSADRVMIVGSSMMALNPTTD